MIPEQKLARIRKVLDDNYAIGQEKSDLTHLSLVMAKVLDDIEDILDDIPLGASAMEGE